MVGIAFRAARLMGLATIVFGVLALLLCDYWIKGVSSQPTNFGGLREGFYAQSCPQAEFIARQTLQANLFLDITAPAALLRLVFHDCQVQGCDGSVLLESDFTRSIRSEMLADKSFGIRRLDFIDRIKGALEFACPNTVSCADVVVMAGRDAVALSGGPFMRLQLGRRDGYSASNFRADADLPAGTVNVDGLLNVFMPKGLTMEESVALIGGGHSLGVGHCVSFINRLYPQVDPAINPFMAGALRLLCPNPVFFSNVTFSANDLTNILFDNQYFRDLQLGRGLLTVDNEISRDPRTAGIVNAFAANQGYFFQQFESAYSKLTQHQVLTAGAGEIRRNCRFVNSYPQRPQHESHTQPDSLAAPHNTTSPTDSSSRSTSPTTTDTTTTIPPSA